MLVPQELVNELGIGQNQQIGLALFAIAWWICRTTPHITSDSCSNFMLTHAGRWGIFAAGGLFVKLTAGLRVRQKALFFQSLAFAIITLAFVAKRVPEESEAIN